MSAYCSLSDVKGRMSGDVPTVSDAWDATITAAIGMVSDMIDQEVRQLRGQGEGWSFLPGTPVTRRYTAARGGSSLLLIDDATAVSAVVILDQTGNLVQTLVSGTDYLPYPLNTLPITGLTLLNGWWPWYPGAVQVTLTPGYGMTVPSNVQDACIAEVIRAIRAGQAGEDDRLGMTPYGSVVVSKALLQSTQRMLARYRFGAGFLRGGS
jgi:hypothetical protein